MSLDNESDQDDDFSDTKVRPSEADRVKDLAVLKVDAPTDLLKPINVGLSLALRVGQQCLTIGNPFGFDHTLTVGVISGLNRDIFSKVGVTIEDGAHFNMKQGAFLYNFNAQKLPKSYHCFSRRLMLEYSKFSSLDSDEPFACKLNNPKHRDTYKQVNVHVLNYEAILWEKLPKFSMQQLYFVGLLWNLPPWPDLSFCKVYWMAMGMEMGAGTVSKRNAYDVVAGQSKNQFQPTRNKQLTDFVKEWVAMVEQYRLNDNKWFSDLYSCRKQWAPGYVNHSCRDGTSAIRKVEKPDPYFDGAVEIGGVRLGQVRNLLNKITYDPQSGAWKSGVNVTNLDKWRKHNVTEGYLLLLKKFKTKDTELFKENVALCSNANAEKGTTGGNDNQNQADLFNWDFLVKFEQSCVNLPEGFKIGFDIVKAVMCVSLDARFIANSELHPNHARLKERVSATSRVNRHMASKLDEDKWRKLYTSPVSGHDPLPDTVQQHRTSIHGITLPSQVSMPLMHKAEKKYEMGKVSEEEEAKQRQPLTIISPHSQDNVNIVETQNLVAQTAIEQLFGVEMTKWFDTNYPFIVPELGPSTKFSYSSHKAVNEYREAKAFGVDTVILPVYKEVIAELKAAGTSCIQFDEPTLVLDLDPHQLAAFSAAYTERELAFSGLNVLDKTYFADIPAKPYKTLTSLNSVNAYGLDFARGTKTLDLVKSVAFPSGKYFLAGVVDGFNSWADDLVAFLGILQPLEFAAQASGRSSPRVTKEEEESAFEMTNRGIRPNTVFSNTIMGNRFKDGRLMEARNIFDLRVCVGVIPDVVSYNIMIYGYGFVGKMDEAVKLLESMVLTGWKPNAFIYSTLLDGYCKEGRTEDTTTLFKEMLGKGINPRAITYISMLDGLFKTWRTAVAKEFLQSLKVVYKLQLPEGVGIYRVIHVSQLKRLCGPKAITSPDLSLVSKDDKLRVEPISVLEIILLLRDRLVSQRLIQWEICHLLMLMGRCQLHQWYFSRIFTHKPLNLGSLITILEDKYALERGALSKTGNLA